MLVTGPDVLTSLVGVLFKVRERKIAVGADIEEMFLQVKIIKEDQQCQHFFPEWHNKKPNEGESAKNGHASI